MGTFSVVPIFGETFQKFFPLTLLFLVLFNMTDLSNRILKVLGLKQWSFNHTNGEELRTEGKLIVHRRRFSLMQTA